MVAKARERGNEGIQSDLLRAVSLVPSINVDLRKSGT